MFYYIDVQENKIISKNEILYLAELTENQIEISEELYNQLQLPATFEIDEEGNIISFDHTPLPPDTTPQTPISEERIAALEEAMLIIMG